MNPLLAEYGVEWFWDDSGIDVRAGCRSVCRGGIRAAVVRDSAVLGSAGTDGRQNIYIFVDRFCDRT